jgi:hypothetical protein
VLFMTVKRQHVRYPVLEVPGHKTAISGFFGRQT